MEEPPLAVVISALIKDNEILLIKRIKGDYVGLLGLLGGKVKKDEHLSEAATREIFEESGIKSEFKNYLGFVSELLIENENILKHLLLHICELEPKTTKISNDSEGELEWFNLKDIKNLQNQIIPSDFLMIKKIVKNREKIYYDCILEKIKDKYFLKKFE